MTERTGTWRARPFSVSPKLSSLPNPFPSADQLRSALSNGKRWEREIFVRLWLSEGVPFSFRNSPALFENLRGWLGNRLSVHPKEITLIGSGRIGYSLASGDQYGREFSETSDLDFSIVSSSLFHLLVQSFYQYADDYESGRVTPTTNRQVELWPENISVCRKNIQRGFLDNNKIPSLRSYPVVRNINYAMWYLEKRLRETPEAPRVKHASVRVYRCWRSFVDQVSLNLLRALDDEDKKQGTIRSVPGSEATRSTTQA